MTSMQRIILIIAIMTLVDELANVKSTILLWAINNKKEVKHNKKSRMQEAVFCISLAMKLQHFQKKILRIMTKKKINKQAHVKEGNKKSNYIQCGWWNNKIGQNHLGRTTKDQVTATLSKHKLDILGISEANILKDDDQSSTKIKGYDTINDKLINSGRARSTIYIKSALKYNIRYDLMEDDTAEVWLEVDIKRGKLNGERILICQFYREQSELRGNKSRQGSEALLKQKERINKWMKKVATEVLSEGKRIYIGGDFNASIGVNGESKDTIGAELEEVLICEAGLDMIVKEPTHQEVKRGMLCKPRTIDHIYCNSPDKTTSTRVVTEAGSHHKLLLTRIMEKTANRAPLQHQARQRKYYTKEKYLEEMDCMDWNIPQLKNDDEMENISLIKSLVVKLTSNLRTGLDKLCPLITLNRRNGHDPWLLEENVKYQLEKEKEAWIKWKNNPADLSLKVKYDDEKKLSKAVINDEKGKSLRKSILEDGDNDGKSLWKNVKGALNWRNGGPPMELKNKDGKLESNLEEVANIYHEAIEEKIENIAQSMLEYEESEEEEERGLSEAGVRRGSEEFNFRPVTQEEVEEVIQKLPRKTSSGDDQVSYIEIKDAAYYVAPMLTTIINLIIQTSHWPKVWSNSVIKPLYKGESDPTEPTSYRPVSLTCALSRVTERMLSSQLVEYLVKNGLVGDECHGFRPGRGTPSGVLEIVEQLQAGVEDGGVGVLLGVDISSAFDVLNRGKLLRQLKIMGAGEKVVRLIKDYFSRRTAQVEIGTKRGERRRSDRGVLQGSGLSPVLFLIYFLRAGNSTRVCEKCKEDLQRSNNDRKNECLRCGNSVIYADDLNIISRMKNFNRKNIERTLSRQGNEINNTLRRISLCMNKKKSQFLCVTTSQRRKASRLNAEARKERTRHIETTIGGTEVKESESVKTLGVRFDSLLNFKSYWEETRKKILSKSFALRQFKDCLSFEDRKTLARGLVVSKIEYCLEATSSCPKSILKLAGKQLNRTVREVTGLWRYEDTSVAYKAAGWQTIEELAIWKTLKTGLTVMRTQEPRRMYCRLTDERDSVRTVKSPVKRRTAIGNRTFSSRFSRIWKIMPEHLKCADLTRKQIKDELKKIIQTSDKDWILWGKARDDDANEEYVDGPAIALEDNTDVTNSNEDIPDLRTGSEDARSDQFIYNRGFSSEQRAGLILIEMNEEYADEVEEKDTVFLLKSELNVASKSKDEVEEDFFWEDSQNEDETDTVSLPNGWKINSKSDDNEEIDGGFKLVSGRGWIMEDFHRRDFPKEVENEKVFLPNGWKKVAKIDDKIERKLHQGNLQSEDENKELSLPNGWKIIVKNKDDDEEIDAGPNKLYRTGCIVKYLRQGNFPHEDENGEVSLPDGWKTAKSDDVAGAGWIMEDFHRGNFPHEEEKEKVFLPNGWKKNTKSDDGDSLHGDENEVISKSKDEVENDFSPQDFQNEDETDIISIPNGWKINPKNDDTEEIDGGFNLVPGRGWIMEDFHQRDFTKEVENERVFLPNGWKKVANIDDKIERKLHRGNLQSEDENKEFSVPNGRKTIAKNKNDDEELDAGLNKLYRTGWIVKHFRQGDFPHEEENEELSLPNGWMKTYVIENIKHGINKFAGSMKTKLMIDCGNYIPKGWIWTDFCHKRFSMSCPKEIEDEIEERVEKQLNMTTKFSTINLYILFFACIMNQIFLPNGWINHTRSDDRDEKKTRKQSTDIRCLPVEWKVWYFNGGCLLLAGWTNYLSRGRNTKIEDNIWERGKTLGTGCVT